MAEIAATWLRGMVAGWIRRAISERYVEPLKKVKTDDLPFDHLFEGKRRMVVSPGDLGGLGSDKPDSADELQKFLEKAGVLKGGEIDWKTGMLMTSEGKVQSKLGKAVQKGIRATVGKDREFYTNMMKVRKGAMKRESPINLTLGVGGNDLRALTGMGHLLVEGFPTKELWDELEKYGVPSKGSWKKIKEAADKFASLSVEEIREKAAQHEEKYKEKAKKHKLPNGLPDLKNPLSKDYENQYWGAKGLFSTYEKARGDEAEWFMGHHRKWVDRTDKFYDSEDSEPVHKLHELGGELKEERFEELRDLGGIEKKQQDYDLWRGTLGQDLAVVISRDPVDVLRMSDHPKAVQAIESCHSEGSSEFDCAIEEAQEGGLIAYVVKQSDVEGRDLEKGELFEDGSRDVKGIKPFARLRLRRFEGVNDDLEVVLPETTTYGASFPDFAQAMKSWARKVQPEFVVGDHRYSKKPSDWRLTGGEYEDNESSELFDSFFNREDDEADPEPTEDQYDPYGEGYTAEDSPYYDPDGDGDDGGEAEKGPKEVKPWRDADRMGDFWTWMVEKYPTVQNPNPRGTKKEITPNTLKGYARGGAGYSSQAREIVKRYMVRYQQEGAQATKVAAVWLRRGN